MELCHKPAVQALNDDIGMKETLECLRCWLIDEAVARFTTQEDAAKKLKGSRRIINYYFFKPAFEQRRKGRKNGKRKNGKLCKTQEG